VREGLDVGDLTGEEKLPSRAVVTVQEVEREIVGRGEIEPS
jgi:hypothetical protein